MMQSKELEIDVYINIARQSARLSKDVNTKVGSVIIDSNGILVSTGRNGAARGLNDDNIPFSRDLKSLSYTENGNVKKFRSNKYPFMRHAEQNAIAYACISGNSSKLLGSTLVVTHFPCEKCASDIAHHGISNVIVVDSDNDVYDSNSTTIDSDVHHIVKYIFAMKCINLYIGNKKVNLCVEK